MKRSGMLHRRPGTAKGKIALWRSRISSASRFAFGTIEQMGLARCTASGTRARRSAGPGRQDDLAFDRPCQNHIHGIMDAIELISRHDLALDLPFVIQS